MCKNLTFMCIDSISFSDVLNLPVRPFLLFSDHATPNVNFPFGYSSSYDGGIHFAEYGRCTTDPDTPTVSYFTSFAVPVGIDGTRSSILNCKNSMRDSKGRVYVFKLKGLPDKFPNNPFPTPQERQAVNSQLIDCTGNTGQVE